MTFFIIRLAALVILASLMVGCGDTAQLESENQRLQRQLNTEQTRTGELTREVARLGAEIRDLKPELEDLRGERGVADRMRMDAISREDQAARWIEQRDEHHALLNKWMERHSECSAERDDLTSRISHLTEEIVSLGSIRDSLKKQLEEASETSIEWMRRHSEGSAKVDEQATTMAHQFDTIVSLEATRDALTKQVEELQEAKEAMRLAVAAAEEQTKELDRLSEQLRILSEEQPTFFISLLAHAERLSDVDLMSWKSISLRLREPFYRMGYRLAVTMPLSLLDPRGDVELRFGALEIVSDQWGVDSKDRIVTFSFPSGERLRSAMEVSSTDIVTVEFGPRDERGVLRFRIKDFGGGLIRADSVEFELLSVEFSGFPVAFRESDGTWRLKSP